MSSDNRELTDLDSQITAAKQAGFTVTIEQFGKDAQWSAILLEPGEIVLSMGEFARFVAEGCKNPERYKSGEGFQRVLPEDIDKILTDLYEKQKPFIEPRSPELAAEHPFGEEEMEGYAKRKQQITNYNKLRNRIHEFLDSLKHKK
jgi:hypothetical protein